jgi:ParB-like chromosome segregation protein Spo0J
MKAPFAVHVPKLIKLSDLNPAAYNPRKISPGKYEALKQSIRIDGFVESVVVQKSDLRIIGGHQKTRAAMELSIEAGVSPPEVPCIVLDIDDARAKKLNVKLNNVRGEFDARLLGELLIDLYDVTIPAEEAIDLGFEQDEAQKLIHLIEPPEKLDIDPDPPSTFGKSITLSLEFTTVEARDRIKKILVERATIEKKKSGEIIAAMLSPSKVRSRAEVKKAKSKSNGKRAHA